MRRILMTLIVVAALLAGCGGDDDDGGPDNGAADEETEAPADDRSSSDGAADDLTGADGQALPEFEGGDEDLAGFPIPSPAGALEATVTEIDGTQAAQIVYTADRYDDVVDAYEGWFLDRRRPYLERYEEEIRRDLGDDALVREDDRVEVVEILELSEYSAGVTARGTLEEGTRRRLFPF